MLKLECEGCGGKLKEIGRFWVCENCGSKYVLGRDDKGAPFTYQPIEKKEIGFGKVAVKASQIATERIAVKEIRLSDSIDADVHRESANIEIRQNIQIISRFLASGEWDAAQTQINHILLNDAHNAEAHWYGWMCDKHLSTENALIGSFSSFSRADAQKLDDILANSTPDFAKHIISMLFEKAYLNDSMCFAVLSVILPYAKNESLFNAREYKEKISNALTNVISRVYPQSFDYLIKAALESSDVDSYISYLERFGNNCKPLLSQKYYREILEVDPGNIAIHRKLVTADIKADSSPDKCLADFEDLLKYSQNIDKEVIFALGIVTSGKTTTSNISSFVWSLLGYHSEAPEALESHIFTYSRILLMSSLWEQARKFLLLVLSFDAQNADAYWLLCLTKLRARSEKEIVNKKDNLIDCPEFKKSLALYQSAGNTQRVNELMAYAKKQKARKKAVKTGVIVVAAVVAFVALVKVLNLVKYSVNVSVAIEETPDVNDWPYEELTLLVKNNGFVDIGSLTGVMTFYDKNGDLITATRIDFLTLPRGVEQRWEIKIDSTSANRLYDYNFRSVKITWATTSVLFSNYKSKELGNGKEKTIKKITRGSGGVDKNLNDSTRARYGTAMAAVWHRRYRERMLYRYAIKGGIPLWRIL